LGARFDGAVDDLAIDDGRASGWGRFMADRVVGDGGSSGFRVAAADGVVKDEGGGLVGGGVGFGVDAGLLGDGAGFGTDGGFGRGGVLLGGGFTWKTVLDRSGGLGGVAVRGGRAVFR